MKKITIYAAIALTAFTSCVQRKDNSKEMRANYELTLSDSIEVVNQQIDSCNKEITSLREEIGVMMGRFTTVSNPREAGSYMILTDCKERYPLAATGLAARINDGGQFELIGALSGKAFDRISISAAGESATTSTVPNDQALNYRTAALTTVMFTGAEVDTVGRFVALHNEDDLKVTFINGSPVQSWQMPASTAAMISETFTMYEKMRELNRLERRVPMLHEKIKLLRLHKDLPAKVD